jgi:hypothetical protein
MGQAPATPELTPIKTTLAPAPPIIAPVTPPLPPPPVAPTIVPTTQAQFITSYRQQANMVLNPWNQPAINALLAVEEAEASLASTISTPSQMTFGKISAVNIPLATAGAQSWLNQAQNWLTQAQNPSNFVASINTGINQIIQRATNVLNNYKSPTTYQNINASCIKNKNYTSIMYDQTAPMSALLDANIILMNWYYIINIAEGQQIPSTSSTNDFIPLLQSLLPNETSANNKALTLLPVNTVLTSYSSLLSDQSKASLLCLKYTPTTWVGAGGNRSIEAANFFTPNELHQCGINCTINHYINQVMNLF